MDIDPEKVQKVNQKISPIQDEMISSYLAEKPLHLHATAGGDQAYSQADIVIIAVPTNYDPYQNYFDTSAVESVIEQVLRVNGEAVFVMGIM